MEFDKKWINWVLETEDEKIIESIGTKCYHDKEWIGKLPKYSGNKNKEDLLSFLRKNIDEFNYSKSNDGIIIDCYSQCLCPLFENGITKNPALCNCTKSFHKNFFDDVLGMNTEIKILKTILRGDESCSFEIILDNLFKDASNSL